MVKENNPVYNQLIVHIITMNHKFNRLGFVKVFNIEYVFNK